MNPLAEQLFSAWRGGQPVKQLSRNHQISRPQSYEIQEAQMQMRLSHGERLVGWKMGLTSQAKRLQMNLDSPLYGYLTDKMWIPNGAEFRLPNPIHPKIEPEIVFRLGKTLRGPEVSFDQAREACDFVASGLEILDSRYDEFKYFSMEDVIADNSSSSHFVCGEWIDFKLVDVADLTMTMKLGQKVVQTGTSKDISGHPLHSVQELVRLLHQQGRSLESGSIVFTGAATAAMALQDGDQYSLEILGLPTVSVSIRK